jgi:uncharacterized membrane protein YedE/YeeE
MISAQVATVAGGFALGAAFGAIVQRTNYCIMGAVADYALSGELTRIRAWMLSIAVAVLCSQGLDSVGLVHLSQTFLRAPALPLVGLLGGGLLFGFGMVIACGCASRSLVNAASGDLRALVTVVTIGIFGYIAMRGVLAPPRLWLTRTTELNLQELGIRDSGLGPLTAAATGLPGTVAGVVSALAVALPLALFALANPAFRREGRLIFASFSLGALIGAGWLVTGVLGADAFDPQALLSMRFVAPTGDGLQYLMLFTGSYATFGIASVGGVLVGAFAAAVASGTFELRAFEDVHDLGRYLVGGALMGVGGVLAMGCTVGQGMTGVSTLAVGSFVATAAIIAGGVLGVRYLEQGSLRGALRATMGRA